jgi:EAL domain-containing protein (putative c-di-GMP-specific phosphodiesterase class I)
MEKRQFEFRYQPICGLESGKVEDFEALLHLRRADGSVDSFNDLLAVSENTGISITLGRVKVDAACRQLRSWSEALPQGSFNLIANLTHRQFYHPDMILQLKKALATNRIDPLRLLIEVPETALNENPDMAAAILERMVDCGVRVAVDNFGSNLAPLNYLVRLPIAMVKLAPELSAAATSTGKERALLKSLIGLGRTLSLQVVAQGIETPEQLEALRGLGCELGQGPLLSPALEPARALKLAEMGRWAVAPRA